MGKTNKSSQESKKLEKLKENINKNKNNNKNEKFDLVKFLKEKTEFLVTTSKFLNEINIQFYLTYFFCFSSCISH